MYILLLCYLPSRLQDNRNKGRYSRIYFLHNFYAAVALSSDPAVS